jgi:hypothetical protein
MKELLKDLGWGLLFWAIMLVMALVFIQEIGDAKACHDLQFRPPPEHEITLEITQHGTFWKHKRNGITVYYPRKLRII